MFVQNSEGIAPATFPKNLQFDSNKKPVFHGDGKWIDYSKVKPAL